MYRSRPSSGRSLAVLAPLVLVAAVAGCATERQIPESAPGSHAIAAAASPTPTAASSVASAGTTTATPAASPDPGLAALDGVPIDPSLGLRLPVAVMIDDNIAARPQYGFNAASIVYQAPADGGEDRYMALFQELDANRVEAIRSGRPYFVNWASEYRAAFAHYGGDAKTLKLLPGLDGQVLYDVDALAGSGSAFHRDAKRSAPHNAYASSDAIRAIAIKHGAPATISAGVGSRPFADDLPADQRPTKGSITIPYNTGTTAYTYDAKANAYLRSVAGKAQIDAADGKRVTARNVVVLFMRLSIDPESEPGHARPVLDQVGTGKAYLFRDGRVIEGTWRKDTAAGLTRFFDTAGSEVTLVRGRIFIQVVAIGTKITYDAAG